MTRQAGRQQSPYNKVLLSVLCIHKTKSTIQAGLGATVRGSLEFMNIMFFLKLILIKPIISISIYFRLKKGIWFLFKNFQLSKIAALCVPTCACCALY